MSSKERKKEPFVPRNDIEVKRMHFATNLRLPACQPASPF